MFALVDQVAVADYSAACTLGCPATTRLLLTISGNPVRYQLGQGWPNPQWGPEAELLPCVASLGRRCDAIRFRSKVAGLTAPAAGQADQRPHVSVEAS